MSKTHLFIGLMIILVMVSACDGQKTTTNYHLGTQGIVLEKLSSNPDIVYEEETFAFGMMLKNQGAADVEGGVLMVNFDDFFLELDDYQSQSGKTQQVTLEGKSIESPMGGADYLEWVFKSKTLEVIRTGVESKVNFNVCYNYNTDLTTEVCLDTRTRTSDQRSYACKSKDYSSNSGQGAPISITKIEPEMMLVGNNVRPLFRIYIKNEGEGYTLSPEKNLCTNPTKNASELNKLKVSAWISDDMPLECNPEEVRLVDGETIARCYVEDGDLEEFGRETVNYLTILRVLLEYDYVDSEVINLKINRINEIDIKSPSVCGYYEMQQGDRCIPLCDFCVNNPNDEACKRNMNASIGFDWNDASDFRCACSKEKCLALNKEGKCIFGYCPGSSYCCSTDECREKADGAKCGDNNVCIANICMRGVTQCDYKFGMQNYTCNSRPDCINTTIKTGYCPGDENNVCCKTTN